MNIFLDSTILFDAIIDNRLKTLLRHVKNDNHTLVTSLTVYGEIVDVCRRENRRDDLHNILDLVNELCIQCSLPNIQLRDCCKCLDKMEKNCRIGLSDRTHLAYSMAYDDDYFLTNENDLLHFPIYKCKCGKATKTQGKIISPDKLREILRH